MSKKNPTIQTTKLGNKVQKGKGKKPEKKTEAEEHVLNAGEEPVGHKETIRFFFGLCFRNTGSSGAVRPKRLRLSGSDVRTVRSLYREDKGFSGRPNAPVACGFDPSGGRGRFPGLRGLRGFRDDSGICYLCLDMYSYAKAPADQTL